MAVLKPGEGQVFHRKRKRLLCLVLHILFDFVQQHGSDFALCHFGHCKSRINQIYLMRYANKQEPKDS